MPKKLFPDGWQTKKLLDMLLEKPGYGANSSSIEFNDNTTYRYIRITDINDQGDLIEENKVGIPLEIGKDYLLKDGDIVIARTGASVGKSYIYHSSDGQCAFAGYLIRLRSDQKRLLSQFLFQYLHSPQFWNWVSRTVKIGAQPNISAEEYSALKIPIPIVIDEQKKIAIVLSSWDKTIKRIIALIESKTKFKQVLMQKLLTGKPRFKEFVKSNRKTKTHYGMLPADWEYPKVEEIADEVSNRNEKGRDIPVLSCTKYDGLVDSLRYFGKRIFSEDTSDYKIVRRDQFAYATNHIEEGSIGLLDSLDKGLVSPMYTVFKTKENVYAPYLYKVFKTELYRHIFAVNTSGSIDRRGGLRWKQFSKIHIPLPSIEEQKKIFACIDTRDREIRLLQQLVEALKTQKKGLMQKLLTGKIRVKV
jgi:type I restriction enzyme S subunit